MKSMKMEEVSFSGATLFLEDNPSNNTHRSGSSILVENHRH